MNEKQANQVWGTLVRIQQTLRLSDKTFSEMLLLTETQLSKYRDLKLDLSFSHLANLSEVLELSFERLSLGKIDYAVLAKQFDGDRNYLPTRYSNAAFSRRRTSMFMLDYVTSALGWQGRLKLLRYFQVSEATFANPDAYISVLFPSDICAYLHRFRFDDEGMFEMGMQTARSRIPLEVRQKLTAVSSVHSIYEVMCQELIAIYYDQNCDYRLVNLDSKECTVDVVPKKEVCEKLKLKRIGNPAVSSLRRGVAASYPVYIGLPHADVKHVKSIFNGDKADRYVINYEKAAHVFRRKKNISSYGKRVMHRSFK